MIIKGIRSLTLEEYKKYKSIIPPMGCEWWLHNAATLTKAYAITNEGTIAITNKDDCIACRPVLIIENLIGFSGDKIEIFGYTWTILDNNSINTFVLCDSSGGHCSFYNEEHNVYIDLQKTLEVWLLHYLSVSEKIVIPKNKTEFLLLQSLCKTYGLNELRSDLFNTDKHLVYSPYQTWKTTNDSYDINTKPSLSFEEFCEYITEEKQKCMFL